MKYPFKLAKSNIIYISIISFIIVIYRLLINGFDSYIIGGIIGTVIGLFLFPLLFALLFWFILGRKKNGGTTTFNIALSIILLGQFSNFTQELTQKQKPINDLKEAISTYKESNKVNPDSADINYAKYSGKIKTGVNELIKTSSGTEKKIFIVLNEFLIKTDSLNINWYKSYNDIENPRILDFKLLNNEKEFDYQIGVIENYTKNSKNFKAFFLNRITHLDNKLKKFNKNNKAVKGVIRGIKRKDSLQRPIFIPYINAHIAYGENLTELLRILKKEKGKWEYKNDEILLDSETSQRKCDSILINASEKEELVNELYDKLIDVM